ncbi:MAG: polyribonucleotide nucleotidyltransferase [Bacteroidota bacterium]
MAFNKVSHTLQLPNNRSIIIETGRFAPQADGAAVVTMGKTILLATAIERQETQPGNFLPLSVDYQEKFHAAGKIPGSFFRREGKLNESEILISRLIDRTIRPCFPPNFFNSVNINVSLISSDEDVVPDTLAILAASAALTLSKIPFLQPVAAVRVAKINGVFYINPSNKELLNADCDIVVAANEEQMLMLEGSAKDISEDELIEILQFAQKNIQEQCRLQNELREKARISPSQDVQISCEEDTILKEFIHKNYYPKCRSIAEKAIQDKQVRKKYFEQAAEQVLVAYETDDPIDTALANKYIAEVNKQVVRDLLIEKNIRIDGRRPDEIRPIAIEVDILTSHGSAIVTRGYTQVLSTLTLGNKLDAQLIDGVTNSGYKDFMVHYSFPGFATNEVKPNRGPARREIGHGNLIYISLKNQLPDKLGVPYCMRLTADTLASDGSSSMAGTVAGSLALMDAGVQIKKPVAGIAMGLIHADTKSIILSDILSDEDAAGDTDLKVTGTRDGITACQMDIKTSGLSIDIIRQMLVKAKEGRIKILDIMEKVLSKPRAEYKPQAPAVKQIIIPVKMIGSVIGPRGKTIQDLQQTTGATITVSDEGEVAIFAPNKASLSEAAQAIERLTEQPTLNKVYIGTIKSIQPYGAFVEFLPNKEGLLHISEVSDQRIEDLAKELTLNQEIEVKLIAIKSIRGKNEYSLSRKTILQEKK